MILVAIVFCEIQSMKINIEELKIMYKNDVYFPMRHKKKAHGTVFPDTEICFK